MSTSGPQKSASEPPLPEPYEDLVRWIGGGALATSATYEQAKARLQTILARELTAAINTFNVTTSRLNLILIALTVVLVVLGVVEWWRQ